MEYAHRFILIRLAILTLILSIFFSCVTQFQLTDKILHKHDDFTYNQLKNNTMIIGGISSQVIDLSLEDRARYSSIISNILLEELADVHTIHIISTPQLLGKIGKESYLDMMVLLDEEPILYQDDISLIKNWVPDTRYILFANIENENVINRSSKEYIDDGKNIETDYERTYLLTIDFQLYDLIIEDLVWNNVIYNQAERTETRSTGSGCFESCATSLLQSILLGTPAEISREEVLEKTTKKFVENLVKTKR